jgi:hypothetical protein
MTDWVRGGGLSALMGEVCARRDGLRDFARNDGLVCADGGGVCSP